MTSHQHPPHPHPRREHTAVRSDNSPPDAPQADRIGPTSKRPWTQAAVELLTRFYGRFPTAYIALALRRTHKAVSTYAHRHGLSAANAPRAALYPSPTAHARFWAAWQHAIRANWNRWAQEGAAEGALDLLWRPPSPSLDCSDCPHRPHCRAGPGPYAPPLPCERLTVRDALEWHTYDPLPRYNIKGGRRNEDPGAAREPPSQSHSPQPR